MADDAKLGILRLPRFPAGWSRTTRTVAALRAILAWYRLFVWGGTFPTLGTVLLLLTQPSRTLAAVSFPVLTGAFAFFHKLLDDELKLRDYRAVYLQDMRFIGWWLAHGGDPCALAKARASTYVPFSTRGQAFLQALGVMHSIGTDQEREFVRHWLMHWIKDVQADKVHKGIDLPQTYTGQNVLIGIVDWGFDYTHPVFYDTLIQQHRILAAWDQFKTNGPAPNGFNYGTEYSNTAALLAAGSDTANIYSYGTHGTHVASIRTHRPFHPSSPVICHRRTSFPNRCRFETRLSFSTPYHSSQRPAPATVRVDGDGTTTYLTLDAFTRCIDDVPSPITLFTRHW